MTDLLAFLAQSRVFLWGAATIIVAFAAAASFLRRRRGIPSADSRQPVALRKHLLQLSIVGLIIGLTVGGLVLLLQPRGISSGSDGFRSQRRPIDVLYLLDVSGSMYGSYSGQAQYPGEDCLDLQGRVRMEDGENRSDCAAIILLEKLLARNPEANVAVLMFGGISVMVGPTADHKALMESVWLNWRQSIPHMFSGATDVKEALVRAWIMLAGEGEGRQNIVPIIIASDLGDADQKAFLVLLADLKSEGAQIVVFAIGAPEYDLGETRTALDGSQIFLIDEKKDIESVFLDLPRSSFEDEMVESGGAGEAGRGLSLSVALGVGMLAVALAMSILFVRTVRWPGGER